MKQTPHPIPSASASQCDLILHALRQARGQWVTMMALHRASGSMAVHSRIAELRKRGHDIAQYNDQVRNARTGRPAVRSHYRLVRDVNA
jgi:radical SAM superfamily enzyme